MNENMNKININWYPGHMAKTKRLIKENLNLIDIIYEVIDSRIPHSSKINDLEELIGEKPRVLIFTKYDLCDKEITDKFIEKYQKEGYYVITYDLTGQIDSNKLINLSNEILKEKLEKIRAKGIKKETIRALVVGIPNAGKSTLINKIVGRKIAVTGNKPGITKNLNWIRVNNDIELMDSPGILWPKLDEERVALNLASLTAIKEEILPIDRVVIYILNTLDKYYNNILKDRYGIDKVDNEEIEETLEAIGRKRGCLVRGGIVDYDKVYNVVINDIKTGALKGITFDRYE